MPHLLRAGRNATHLDDFLAHDRIAVGWDVGDLNGLDTAQVKERLREAYPDDLRGKIASSAGQLLRFRDIAAGETVAVYDPSTRTYHVGEVTTPYRYDEEAPSFRHRHDIDWRSTVPRDRLSLRTRNALGSVSTLFTIREDAWAEMQTLIDHPDTSPPPATSPIATDEDDSAEEYREEIVDRASELIKDRISALAWNEMEELCAGVLRGMGYKTMLTDRGSDGGRDIMASPDGLGLEPPRIIVEVKHRKGKMGAPDIRNLLGGLRSGDRGLYISTGGFTQEARYEADRAASPVTLLDLDRLTALIVQYYDAFDSDTQALLPLRKIYWPV